MVSIVIAANGQVLPMVGNFIFAAWKYCLAFDKVKY